MWSIVASSKHPSPLTQTTQDGIAIHRKAEIMPGLPMGPFTRRADGAIVGVADNCIVISTDEGRSWSTLADKPVGEQSEIRIERALLHIGKGVHESDAINDIGVLILAYADAKQRHWTWADEIHDAPGAILPTCAARSLNGGRTWRNVQKLHDEWTGAIRDIIQMRSGRVVFTTMKMLHKPGRHAVLTYASDDAGANWMASNLLDFGGIGHHDGAMEATLVELNDGRLLKYIRTNWGQFWRAESTDGGHYWHTIGPAGVPASTAPGLLFRMQSGRIALLWNRPSPEDSSEFGMMRGDRISQAVPVVNHRAELSLSWSEDECESWSAPIVIAAKSPPAELKRNSDAWLAYPYAFEPEPGVLWVTTMQGNLRLQLREEDF